MVRIKLSQLSAKSPSLFEVDFKEFSYVMEQGNWPIFSTEFEKLVYILAELGKQEYCLTWKFCILKDGIWQSSNPTDTDIALTLV